jgi:hypothetical protein
VLALGFNEAGSRAGGSTQINADGIADWGTTATAAANTFYMLARNATVGGASAGATLGAAVDAITWEFKLATFTIDVGGVGTGSTSFNIIQPNAKATVGAQTYATAKIDNATFNVTSTAPAPPTRAARASPSARSPNRRASACWARLPSASWAVAASKPFRLRETTIAARLAPPYGCEPCLFLFRKCGRFFWEQLILSGYTLSCSRAIHFQQAHFHRLPVSPGSGAIVEKEILMRISRTSIQSAVAEWLLVRGWWPRPRRPPLRGWLAHQGRCDRQQLYCRTLGPRQRHQRHDRR